MRRLHTIITTVGVPAASYLLVDLATIKTLLQICDSVNDAYLNLVIDRASTAAANYCNRVFPVETVTDTFLSSHWHFRRTGGIGPLVLTRWPITGITSVTEDGVALVQDVDYIRDDEKGELTRIGPTGYPTHWLRAKIIVTYSAGYATIPSDLADAVERMVKAAWFSRNRDPMLRMENAEGVYSAQYFFGAGPGSDGSIAPDIAALLDTYSVPLTG